MDSSKKLFKPVEHKCDLCGQIFQNSYTRYVHNVHHIIIPLQRVNIELHSRSPNKKCLQDDFLMPANNHLKNHKQCNMECKVILHRLEITKLPKEDISQDINGNEQLTESVNQEESDEEISLYYDEDEPKEGNNIDAGEEYPLYIDEKCFQEESDKEKQEMKLKKEPREPPSNDQSIHDDDVIVIEPAIKFENEVLPKAEENYEPQITCIPNIRNRIIFEDDVIVTVDTTPINTSSMPVRDTNSSNSLPNMTVSGNQIYEEDGTEKYRSIHYDTLIEPGSYTCNKCKKAYPNRFLLIQHETSHMYWKKPRPKLCPHCDRYVSLSPAHLLRHMRETHPNVKAFKKFDYKKCTLCGLRYYKYFTHRINYHQEIESVVKDQMNKVGPVQLPYVKETHVCELCASFFKEKKNCHFVFLKYEKYENRAACDKCGKMFFQLMSYRQQYMLGRSYNRKEKKPLSNREKLKNIHNRLKMMKRC